MNDLKASQRTTRRDIPSARRLLQAAPLTPDEPPASEPPPAVEQGDRPSGVRSTTTPEGHFAPDTLAPHALSAEDGEEAP
jgi:hypothetical protein